MINSRSRKTNRRLTSKRNSSVQVLTDMLTSGFEPGKEGSFLMQVGYAVISLSDSIEELKTMVQGNGRLGLLDRISLVETSISSMETSLKSYAEIVEEITKSKSTLHNRDTFSIFVGWLADKVVPGIISAIIIFVLLRVFPSLFASGVVSP